MNESTVYCIDSWDLLSWRKHRISPDLCLQCLRWAVKIIEHFQHAVWFGSVQFGPAHPDLAYISTANLTLRCKPTVCLVQPSRVGWARFVPQQKGAKKVGRHRLAVLMPSLTFDSGKENSCVPYKIELKWTAWWKHH